MAQQRLFRKKTPEPEQNRDVFELTRRSRMLEERYSNLERRSQVTEENMVEHHRKLSSEIRLLNGELADMKKAIADLNEKMQKFSLEYPLFNENDGKAKSNLLVFLWKMKTKLDNYISRVYYKIR